MNSAEFVLIICLVIEVCAANVDLFTKDRLRLGLVLPYQVDAVVGEDIFLRITDTVPNQEKCLFHRNGAIDASAPKDK